MKPVEKFAVVLIAVGALHGPAMWVLLHFTPSLMQGENLSMFEESVGILSSIATSLVDLVCATWLYQAARRHGHSKWIWCLVGLLFKLPGIAIYYGVAILDKMEKEDANQALNHTSES